MTAWGAAGTSIAPDAGYQVGSYPGAYSVETTSLAYPAVNNALLLALAATTGTYRLAFSTDGGYIHPSVGQLWPRGQGNRI